MTEAIFTEGAAAPSDHPWLVRYPRAIDWAAPIPVEPLYAFFDRSVAAYADRPCLDFLGRRYTYADVGRLVNRAAQGFRDLGVGPGVQVGLCLPNTPYYVICYFAVLKAGGTVVNYNPLYAPRELEHQVEDSGTTIMVTLDLAVIYPKVADLLRRTGLKRIVVCRMADALPALKGLLFPLLKRADIAAVPHDGRHVRFHTLVAKELTSQPPPIDPLTHVAVLQYTGGTTGVPKGAMLTHANLVANLEQIRRWFIGVEEGRERMLAVLPFFHVFAMTVTLNLGLAVGSEIIMVPRFDMDAVLALIAKRKPTLFPGVPTLFKAIADKPGINRADMASIRLCISGGAPLPVEVKTAFEALTGCVLVEGYGLTEASPVCTCNPLTGVNKAGSIGLPLSGTIIEIRTLGDAVRVLPPGEKGEVCIRGPQVMAGYWNRQDETDRTMIDGALRTGDVGYMDDDGYTFLVDRIKDVILCGGYNVYPRAIEEAIYQHPDVVAVTVIGLPDSYRGQKPKAFIQRRDGATVTPEEMKRFLADKLSPIEMPSLIEFRVELPKTTVGKLSKKELLAEELAKLDQGGVAPP
ncbi:MAG TPA: long-chain fatty acid--CoA ligase [Azospirillaceae bacterium]|nr:long-chain fatty acid--CoA ligase [Azospirillaceae bacterium]